MNSGDNKLPPTLKQPASPTGIDISRKLDWALDAIRTSKGHFISDIAKEANLSTSTVHRWFTNPSAMKMQMRAVIIRYFNIRHGLPFDETSFTITFDQFVARMQGAIQQEKVSDRKASRILSVELRDNSDKSETNIQTDKADTLLLQINKRLDEATKHADSLLAQLGLIN